MNISRGFRDKLEKYLDINQSIEVEMNVKGPDVYDYCCFGVDSNDKLSDDRYMVFYNQTQSPKSEIVQMTNGQKTIYKISLNKLPNTINKLVFTVSIDGNGTMGKIDSYDLTIKQSNNSIINMRLSGKDFKSEKAIISIELYKKEVWRYACIASGFNGGLGDLLKSYGGEEIEEQSQPSALNQSFSNTQINQPRQTIKSQNSQTKPQNSTVQDKINLSANNSKPINFENSNSNRQYPINLGSNNPIYMNISQIQKSPINLGSSQIKK